MSRLSFPTPYLLFLGDRESPLDAKTALGLMQWRPEKCLGQWSLPGCQINIGLEYMDPKTAYATGARSLIIGVAPSGGGIPEHWIPSLVKAVNAGMDIVSGMHTSLSAIPELVDAAERNGQHLVDVRIPPRQLKVASGRKRSGKRLLTVGTDCCVGKKYSALALHQSMTEAGLSATFRATGQTGIMIAGEGIPLDAVVADFLPGAAEILSPDNDEDHWDVIEGQGSLYHPAYAAVTLGLIHGSQPDALVLCHEAGRVAIDEYPNYAIPPLLDCLESYQNAAQLTNSEACFIGACINTSSMSVQAADRYLATVSEELGLPCVDPLRGGLDQLIDRLR